MLRRCLYGVRAIWGNAVLAAGEAGDIPKTNSLWKAVKIQQLLFHSLWYSFLILFQSRFWFTPFHSEFEWISRKNKNCTSTSKKHMMMTFSQRGAICPLKTIHPDENELKYPDLLSFYLKFTFILWRFLVISGFKRSLGKLLFWLNGVFQLEDVRRFSAGPKPSAKHWARHRARRCGFCSGCWFQLWWVQGWMSCKGGNVIWCFWLLRMCSLHCELVLSKEEEGEEVLNKPMGWFPAHEQESEQGWFALVFGCQWMFCTWVRQWMPKSETVTVKEIVINLPYLSLLRTRLYITLHCSTKCGSTAAVC